MMDENWSEHYLKKATNEISGGGQRTYLLCDA